MLLLTIVKTVNKHFCKDTKLDHLSEHWGDFKVIFSARVKKWHGKSIVFGILGHGVKFTLF